MDLIAIKETLEENPDLVKNPACEQTLNVCIEYYKRIGFNPPWICYYVAENGQLIGNAAFKGKPVNGSIEIAYGVMEEFRKQGIGTRICKTLVDLAMATDSKVRITARTLPENNYSTRILQKNNFKLLGTVDDPEDGPVWEWEFIKPA